ncbi:uncharacterized protein [Nicotiana tomentosiformis]|uniref:uncharacterized protein n=1 Tax=Nicotiana tomentosiformis TaxID=4098 RepID=UPI00388CD6AF
MDRQSERTITILEDMLRAYVIDFGGQCDRFLPLEEFSYNNSYHSSIQTDPYEALYDRQCCYLDGWFAPGKARLLGTDLVRDALEKVKLIQERFHTTQSRQKSYSNRKACDVPFMLGEKVLPRVSPMKGVMRFGKKHKLDFSSVQMDKYLTYDEEPVAILDRQVQKLRSKDIASVKVQLRVQQV